VLYASPMAAAAEFSVRKERDDDIFEMC
jgi:hypothetical protein